MRDKLILSAIFYAAFGATAASAQQPDDAWLAWAGCCRAEVYSSGNALCIVPDGD